MMPKNFHQFTETTMDSRIEQIIAFQKKSNYPNSCYSSDKSTWKYIKYRVRRPIIKLFYKAYRKKNAPTPWLPPSVIEYFNQYLTKEMTGVEFGSGISTLFFAPKIKKIVSIEHDEAWYKQIKKELATKNIDNIDYHLVKRNDAKKNNYPTPEFINTFNISSDEYEYRKEFYEYFMRLEEYNDESFDFIIVDGRARPECVFASIPKLKKKGILVLDNSERHRYRIVFDRLKEWETCKASSGLTDTTFWIKP